MTRKQTHIRVSDSVYKYNIFMYDGVAEINKQAMYL